MRRGRTFLSSGIRGEVPEQSSTVEGLPCVVMLVIEGSLVMGRQTTLEVVIEASAPQPESCRITELLTKQISRALLEIRRSRGHLCCYRGIF